MGGGRRGAGEHTTEQFAVCVQRFQGLVAASISSEPDSITEWVLRSYAPATLRSYAGVLARCSALLGSTPEAFGVGIERVLVSLLGPGRSGSQIRILLSALGLVDKIGLWAWSPPRVWWRLPTVGARLGAGGEGFACDPRWFEYACDFCQAPLDWVVLGTCLFAFVYGFRISEAVSFFESLRGGSRWAGSGEFSFQPAKRPLVARCVRPLTVFLERWLGFLELVAPVVVGDFSTSWKSLFSRAGLPGVSFHGWRRATARWLFKFGVSVPKILVWCRWEDFRMLQLYLGSNVLSGSESFALPSPPLGSIAGGSFRVERVPFSAGLCWPGSLFGPKADGTDERVPRRAKRRLQ